MTIRTETVDAMVAMLLDLQRYGCPICRVNDPLHEPDCKLAALLRDAGATPNGPAAPADCETVSGYPDDVSPCVLLAGHGGYHVDARGNQWSGGSRCARHRRPLKETPT